MTGPRESEPSGTTGAGVDFSALYDAHPEYVARRTGGSFEQALIDIEVKLFKLPQLLAVLPDASAVRSVLEIGCATGELIAAMPAGPDARRLGVDISPANIAVARSRFADVEFRCGDFREVAPERFDVAVLSDVLEHVPDDAGFLRDASDLAETVLVNLPLEDNWLNRARRYGPNDVSGHLRRYGMGEALELMDRAGLEVVAQSRVWFHETPAEAARRSLRERRLGQAYAGTWPGRQARRVVFSLASRVPPLGRRLFASNLFLSARRRRAVSGADLAGRSAP